MNGPCCALDLLSSLKICVFYGERHLSLRLRFTLSHLLSVLQPASTSLLFSPFGKRETEAVYSNSSWSVADQDWT